MTRIESDGDLTTYLAVPSVGLEWRPVGALGDNIYHKLICVLWLTQTVCDLSIRFWVSLRQRIVTFTRFWLLRDK